MGNHNFLNFRKMKCLITTLFFVLSLAYFSHAADIVVDIDMDEVSDSEMNGALMDRTIVCQFWKWSLCNFLCRTALHLNLPSTLWTLQNCFLSLFCSCSFNLLHWKINLLVFFISHIVI